MRRLGEETDLVQTVLSRKLKFFGHIVGMSYDREIKAVMMDEGIKRGRPRREWLDDIQDGCNQEVWSLVRLARDRDQWLQTVKGGEDSGFMMMVIYHFRRNSVRRMMEQSAPQ